MLLAIPNNLSNLIIDTLISQKMVDHIILKYGGLVHLSTGIQVFQKTVKTLKPNCQQQNIQNKEEKTQNDRKPTQTACR